MKLCQKCGQSVAEDVGTCPSCGGEVGEGIKFIDEYRIEEVLHEGHDSILCRAVKEGDEKPVMIRLFTPQSALNEEVADRLKKELEELKKLPPEHFVSHQEIRRSSEGLWYRVSEWVDAESWGDLVRSGHLEDYRVTFELFSRIASVLAILHKTGHIIPHLILNDIMLIKEDEGKYNVKIDYKLSRFLDPKLDRPGPMLKRLLACHPDIINQRPLDFRSDVWSLGKIFIELLTADYETCDFTAKIDGLSLPSEAEALFRTMLAEDPALRPDSMDEVADTLSRISAEEIEKAKTRAMELVATSAKTVRRIKRRQTLLAAAIGLLIVAGGVAWYQMGAKKNSVAVLESYANQYAPSVAFVVVEYWLKEGENTVYRNRAEGTAFLADRDGYLLTNRHVACPWLEDGTLLEAISFYRQSGRLARFGYKILLWFEGEKAFKRSADLIGSQELGDIYFPGSGFRSDGIPRLTIAGVAKPPVQTRKLVTSPLRNDFAVLKIDRVPAGLSPLPLDLKLDPRRIPKLSRVMTLGFPLGSRYQESTVNVSVTGGHVRRTFEDLLQVDIAFYGGDSGGPIIDTRGKVIGIASGVATTLAPGVMPITTPLWNLAMVQPITKAATFLQELKAGQVKWNGILDLSLEGKLREIIRIAFQGRWAEAMALADNELKRSSDPSLVMAGGMMHFCAGDDQGASRLFTQSVSIDPQNSLARLMLYIIDWQMRAPPSGNIHRDTLLALDWRSEAEFLGYVCRVLEGVVDEEIALKGWDTAGERSWLHYAVGLIKQKQGQWAESEKLLKEAVLSSNAEAWEFFLSRARLEEVQKRRLDALQGNGQWTEYRASIDAFNQTVQKDQMTKEGRQSELAALRAELQNPLTSMKDRREALEKISEEDSDNGDALVGLAFLSGMEEVWDKALTYTQKFLKRSGRQSASRMRMGLLEAEIMHYTGKREEAQAGLEAYTRVTRDSWFRSISECLLGKRSVDSLKKEAGKYPENLLTLYTALGLWAEGSDDKAMAAEYYEEALESLLDTWHEFALARERIRRLRQDSG